MSRAAEKAEAFCALHDGPPFLIPNPWDAGTARILEALGFPALATTSSGFAFTLGRRDGGATLDEVADHVAALDAATALPVAVDLENGYGPEPEAAANAVRRAAGAGAAGGSIEDWDPPAAFTWVAVKAMADAAVAMRDTGDLSALEAQVPLAEWFGG